MNPAFYITTPIYYVNDKPHIGHAYTSIACDALARFKRLDGYEVHFLTGTDEHGQKVEKSAEQAGVTPQEFVDMVSEFFRELASELNLSNDGFIRTTEARHKQASQALWNRLIERGDIYLGSYAGWYSVRDEAFYAEDELVEGNAPTGAPVEWVEEPSYFFRLSAWQDRLLAFYEAHPDFIQPAARRNEVISFVRGGLHDLSVSRTSFSWGVPVPGDDAHVMYVWLDALTNYLTELGYPNVEADAYQTFWQRARKVHVVGKDILRFHAVYWPAFLMSAGLEVPDQVFAHGWWTNEGQKISKSIGNVIKPEQLIETYGLDQTRYFLLREVPFGNDGNFSSLAMVQRINSDLANTIGNLAQRTLSLAYKYCDAAIPTIGEHQSADREVLSQLYGVLDPVREAMDALKFHHALELILERARLLNEYIDAQAPWALRKTDQPLMETVLHTVLEGVRVIGILLQPFIPDAASHLLEQLGISQEQRSLSQIHADHALQSGTAITAPSPVFPRFDSLDKTG